MPKFYLNTVGIFLRNLLYGYTVFSNLLKTAFVLGIEQLTEDVAFKCPSNPELARIIGLFYLFFPPILTFLIIMSVNTKFWFLYHGCCRFGKKDQPKTVKEDIPNGEMEDQLDSEENQLDSEGSTEQTDQPNKTPHVPFPDAFTVKIYEEQLRHRKYSTVMIFMFRALLAPCVWIVTALFDGDFLVCHYQMKPEEESKESIKVKEISRFAAWIVLLSFAICGTIGMCIIRGCDKRTFLHNLYDATYWDLLQREIKPKAKKKAKQDAKALVAKIGIVVEPEDVEKKPDNAVPKRSKGEKQPKKGFFDRFRKSKKPCDSTEQKSPQSADPLESTYSRDESGNDETSKLVPSGSSIQ